MHMRDRYPIGMYRRLRMHTLTYKFVSFCLILHATEVNYSSHALWKRSPPLSWHLYGGYNSFQFIKWRYFVLFCFLFSFDHHKYVIASNHGRLRDRIVFLLTFYKFICFYKSQTWFMRTNSMGATNLLYTWSYRVAKVQLSSHALVKLMCRNLL